MRNFFQLFLKVVVALLLLGLFFGFYRLNKDIEKLTDLVLDDERITETLPSQPSGETEKQSQLDTCGEVCKKEIEDAVSRAVATLSGIKVTTISSDSTKYSPKTSFISLGSTHSTTSTDWVGIDDTRVYIDLESDFGKEAKVSWEAQLKVAHGNGKAYARLWDDTNKIAVDFSELSSENNSSFKQVASGNLPFWRGRNLYLVQIKSLNSFEITLTGARIKINY